VLAIVSFRFVFVLIGTRSLGVPPCEEGRFENIAMGTEQLTIPPN